LKKPSLTSSSAIYDYVKVQQLDDNPYEINNIYIELSIVFHPMIIFFRK
jgi:hypothetical protein